MGQCNKCLLTENNGFKPTIQENGACRACNVSATPDFDLSELVETIKVRRAGRYDCIVLLRGTPEDYFVVSTLLKQDLYPLCVYVNSFFANDLAWENVHGLIHKYDLELRCFNPNIQHYKVMVKYALRRFSDILTPQKLISFCYVMTLAKSLSVKFVVSGENQVSINARKYLNQKIPEQTAWSVIEHDAHTTSLDFFGPSLELRDCVKDQYNPMKTENWETSWVFLSDFVPWDQLQQDAEALRAGAFAQVETTTFDVCHRAGSSVFYNFQDLLRYYKTGELKVTEQLSREVRLGRLSRSRAIELNDKFVFTTLDAARFDAVVGEFFSWLGLEGEALLWAKKHRLPQPVNGPTFTSRETMKIYLELLNTEEKSITRAIRKPEKSFCIFHKGARV